MTSVNDFDLVFRDTVLVTAAAGATGLAAVDIAANVFSCEVRNPNIFCIKCHQ